jgi:pilus assembly protein CpaB
VVARAVTIEVTPNQAQMITLAQSVGGISLSLRQITDRAPLARRAMTVAQLGYFRAPRPPGASGPAAAKLTGHPVRVTRGIETAEYRVP